MNLFHTDAKKACHIYRVIQKISDIILAVFKTAGNVFSFLYHVFNTFLQS